MILAFRDGETQKVFEGRHSRRLPTDIQRTAFRKLAQLDQAGSLLDLRALPGNHLAALKGNRAGQHSIRINQQWRVCFRWTPQGVEDVEIADYH
jgi:proteic killer suppression protein